MVSAIEEHRFPAVRRLVWRSVELDFTSPQALLDSLSVPPTLELFNRVERADDFDTLKALSNDPEVLARMRPRFVQRERPEEPAPFGEDLAPLLARVFAAQRTCVLDARADGVYSSEALATALARIDSVQLGMQLAKSGVE